MTLPCVLSVAVFAGVVAQPRLPLKRIFDKPYLAGTRPHIASLSPDGTRLLFQWDSTSNDKRTLWSVSTRGGVATQMLDSAVSACAWSPDGKRVAFIQNGDLFISDATFTQVQRLTRTPASESQLTWSDDGRFIAVATNNILVFSTDTPGFFQLTANTSADISYAIVGFSPDSRRLLLVEYNSEGLPEFIVPRYLDSNVTAPTSKRGFAKVRIGIAPIDTGATLWLRTTRERFLVGDVSWSRDGKSILYEEYTTDRKSRDILVAETDSGTTQLRYSEHDEKWIRGGGLQCLWAGGGGFILFTSERDGWNHLYSMKGDSSDVRQLTSGAWEIRWFAVHPRKNAAYIQCNKDDHSQWQLYMLDMGTGGMSRLTTQTGTYESPVMSNNGEVVVSAYSYFDKPSELHSIGGQRERKLTSSIPQEFTSHTWIVPDIVRFTATDGTVVPAMIYKPARIDSTRKYPAVVFVHGAGYLQNVFQGWSYYHREYMFNNHLVDKGCIVFEVDYRGSAGYGRNYRTDVHMHLGGLDLQDELDGVEYLKRLGYIDSTRIGMYGGSYGGFLSLMALFTSPETFACAAVLRAVTSWENYYRHNPWYTIARLGTPEANPEAYRRSSPLTFADSLKKPLLILHGLGDDNVFFQDAAQLVDKLQRAGRKFELMIYPSESHSFTEPHSWYDEYHRIDEFFDRYLLSKD
jgi:dipeptidyl aminopeptidase/acylaminoacyl peptidase